MFPDAEMQVTPGGIVSAEIARVLERQTCLAGRREVGGTTDQPQHVFGDGVQHQARGVASCDPLYVRGKSRQDLVPSVGQLASQHAVANLGKLGVLASVRFEL